MSRILIIDDDLYIRELYEEVLKSEGHDVEIAVDGETGLGKIIQGGYDLILLDVMMPKIDGLGVLTKLIEKPPLAKNGPIILLTNLAQNTLIEEGLKKGASSYIIKTDLTPDQLIAKLKPFLSAPRLN